MVNIGTSTIRDMKVNNTSTVPGDGVTFESDTKVSIIASSTEESTHIYKELDARAGETITVKFKARVTSGTMGAAIDYPVIGTKQDYLVIGSPDWQEYVLSATVPLMGVSPSASIKIALGMYMGLAGTCELADVQIFIENSQTAFTRTHCAGLIRIVSGVPSVHESFTAIGIDREDLATKTATTSLIVKTKPVLSLHNLAPIFSVQFTPDSYNLTYNIRADIGNFNYTTGEIKIQFVNTSTGALVDVSSIHAFYLNLIGLVV